MRGQKYLVCKKQKYTPEIAMSWKLLKQIRRSMNTIYGIALHKKKWMNQSKHCNFANILQDSRTSRKDSTRRNLNTGIISLKENMMSYYFSEDKLPKPVVFFFF